MLRQQCYAIIVGIEVPQVCSDKGSLFKANYLRSRSSLTSKGETRGGELDSQIARQRGTTTTPAHYLAPADEAWEGVTTGGEICEVRHSGVSRAPRFGSLHPAPRG